MKKRIRRTESLSPLLMRTKKVAKVTLCALSKSHLVKKNISKPLKKKRQGYNFEFKPKTPRARPRLRTRGVNGSNAYANTSNAYANTSLN